MRKAEQSWKDLGTARSRDGPEPDASRAVTGAAGFPGWARGLHQRFAA